MVDKKFKKMYFLRVIALKDLSKWTLKKLPYFKLLMKISETQNLCKIQIIQVFLIRLNEIFSNIISPAGHFICYFSYYLAVWSFVIENWMNR